MDLCQYCVIRVTILKVGKLQIIFIQDIMLPMKKEFLISVLLFFMLAILSACQKQLSEPKQPYHLTVKDNWSNDLQTISWNDEKKYYDIYFLHSKDGASNPFGENGQDWYHTTTSDFITYSPQTSAISSQGGHKTQGFRSAWTGSVITNSKGLFKDIAPSGKIAYISGLKKDDGSQNIWGLWSEDGKRYSHVLNGGKPILTTSLSANHSDFRDPYVIYYKDELLMYVAEGDVIGVYRSKDGLNWSKADPKGQSKILASTFFKGRTWDGNAPVECPVIKTMQTSDGKEKQILFFGAKDASKGETTGTYYTVGRLDENGLFVAETNTKRLDLGSDYYGANFSGSETLDEVSDELVTMGWIGNWNYSAKGIHSDQEAKSDYIDHLGTYSLARQLTLNPDLTLTQTVITNKTTLQKVYKNITVKNPISQDRKAFENTRKDGTRAYGLVDLAHQLSRQRYQLIAETLPSGKVYLDIWQGGDYMRMQIDMDKEILQVSTRAGELDNGLEGQVSSSYYYDGLLGDGEGYQVSFDKAQWKTFKVDIFTDDRVVEFFFPDGQSYTLSRFSNRNHQDVKLYTTNESLILSLLVLN